MAKYKRVGGGTYGIYKKKENPWPWIIGGGFLLLVLIGSADSDAAGTNQPGSAPTAQTG